MDVSPEDLSTALAALGRLAIKDAFEEITQQLMDEASRRRKP